MKKVFCPFFPYAFLHPLAASADFARCIVLNFKANANAFAAQVKKINCSKPQPPKRQIMDSLPFSDHDGLGFLGMRGLGLTLWPTSAPPSSPSILTVLRLRLLFT